jgi:hypothetical protein
MAAISSIEQFWIVGVRGSVEVPLPPQQLKVHASVPPSAHRIKWVTLFKLNSFYLGHCYVWTLKRRKKRKQMAAISSIEQFWIVRVRGSMEVPSLPQQLKVHASVPPIAHRNKWKTLLMLNSFYLGHCYFSEAVRVPPCYRTPRQSEIVH